MRNKSIAGWQERSRISEVGREPAIEICVFVCAGLADAVGDTHAMRIGREVRRLVE